MIRFRHSLGCGYLATRFFLLSWENRTVIEPLFSERFGYRRVLRLGDWAVMLRRVPWPGMKDIDSVRHGGAAE